MPKITELARGERRQRLVDAAAARLADRSWRDLTVEDIAATAGMAKGGFYGYFDSKDELLVALVESDAAAIEERLHRIAAERHDVITRLRAAGQAMVELAAEPERAQLHADVWAAVAGDEQLASALREATARRRLILRRWIDDGVARGEVAEVPANAVAALLLALQDGLILHHAVDPSGFRWTNVRRALDVLLGGLAR